MNKSVVLLLGDIANLSTESLFILTLPKYCNDPYFELIFEIAVNKIILESNHVRLCIHVDYTGLLELNFAKDWCKYFTNENQNHQYFKDSRSLKTHISQILKMAIENIAAEKFFKEYCLRLSQENLVGMKYLKTEAIQAVTNILLKTILVNICTAFVYTNNFILSDAISNLAKNIVETILDHYKNMILMLQCFGAQKNDICPIVYWTEAQVNRDLAIKFSMIPAITKNQFKFNLQMSDIGLFKEDMLNQKLFFTLSAVAKYSQTDQKQLITSTELLDYPQQLGTNNINNNSIQYSSFAKTFTTTQNECSFRPNEYKKIATKRFKLYQSAYEFSTIKVNKEN